MISLRLPLFAAVVTAASIITIGGATFGCNRSGAQLRDAAAADLNCPRNRVHIVGASKTKDVEACGQHATYRFEDGDWVMVSREGAAPAGAAAPAGPPGVQPARPVTGTPTAPPSSPPPPVAGQKAL